MAAERTDSGTRGNKVGKYLARQGHVGHAAENGGKRT